MIKHQIFVNKHLPVQTQRNEINISVGYSVCLNLLIKIILQQCHWRNSSVAFYHFSAWYYFLPRCIYCLFHILNGITYTEAQRFKAQHCTPIELLSRQFLMNSPKFEINYFSKTSLDSYFKLTSDFFLKSVPQQGGKIRRGNHRAKYWKSWFFVWFQLQQL